MKNRAGEFRNNLSGEMAYQSFLPSPLPPSPPIAMDEEMVSLLVSARSGLALLDGLFRRLPGLDAFVPMFVLKEALLSSRIEGNRAALEDILDPALRENRSRDAEEVLSCARAASYAVRRLGALPLRGQLIREIHGALLGDTRGQKGPGEFRRSQNWIGGEGRSIQNARFIPPNPEDMLSAMSDLEEYLRAGDTTDPLVRLALVHYQFETIHPFPDGNGRVGRIMATLYLLENRLLSSPVLCLSGPLARDRGEYYDRLSEVRRTGNYEQWVRFFLRAVSGSADDAVETADRLSALGEKNRQLVQASFGSRSRRSAGLLLSYLERSPLMETGMAADALGVSYNTVSRLSPPFRALGILRESSKDGKARVYAYGEFLDILRQGT